jgi:hypothetical protein
MELYVFSSLQIKEYLCMLEKARNTPCYHTIVIPCNQLPIVAKYKLSKTVGRPFYRGLLPLASISKVSPCSGACIIGTLIGLFPLSETLLKCSLYGSNPSFPDDSSMASPASCSSLRLPWVSHRTDIVWGTDIRFGARGIGQEYSTLGDRQVCMILRSFGNGGR